MIDRSEIEAVAARFGAPDTQIIHDHLISHVLAAIADWPDSDRVTFFGGTALCRTWVPDLRLSEDIDLLIDSPTDGKDLRQHASRRLRREFPNLGWARLGAQHQVETWTLAASARRRRAPRPRPGRSRRRHRWLHPQHGHTRTSCAAGGGVIVAGGDEACSQFRPPIPTRSGTT